MRTELWRHLADPVTRNPSAEYVAHKLLKRYIDRFIDLFCFY